jgi:thiamine-phosphate pyrophosphorylase
MHNNLPSYFFFIDTFQKDHIRKLDKEIAIIYRNYSINHNKELILEIKKICKKDKRKFFLSNNIKLAINLDLDGVYLPSFNKNLNINIVNARKKFRIIGSAHSEKEIRIKEKQNVELIFISPLFKTKKNKQFLDPVKFNLLTLKTNKKVIALGGINSNNLNKLNMVNAYGLAGISYFEKNDNIKVKK